MLIFFSTTDSIGHSSQPNQVNKKIHAYFRVVFNSDITKK